MRKIYPNDPCPCGSGKKYKKCCSHKLEIPEEKLTLSYWVNYLSKNDLVEEKLQFFETEKKLANNKLCSMIGNIKKCFVKGKISFEEVLKEVNHPCDEYPIVSEYAFKDALEQWEEANTEDRVVDNVTGRTEKVPNSNYRLANNPLNACPCLASSLHIS